MVTRAGMIASAIGALGLGLALAGCDPEIISGSYFCGPQMSCPSGEVCNPADSTCGRPELARPFACAAGSEDGEPNEGAATASAFVVGGCPASQVEQLGCLPAPTDVDWIAVDATAACAGGRLSIDVRYSAAFAPVVVDLMAADGQTVSASAMPCDITGGIGENDAVCLDTTVPADGRALIRVGLDPDLDCDGACAFSRYSVTASTDAP